MWKSLIYKEWLKIRWFLFIFTVAGLVVTGYIFLRVQHDFTFNEAKNYWYLVLFQGFRFFDHLKFIPLAGGLAIGIAQFFPETVNKRIKLTFHLPLKENLSLLMMMLFGTICLLASYILVILFFLILSTLFFPSNIIIPVLVAVAPWFFAGLMGYYLVALIILEPVWKFRVLYLLVAAAIIPVFLETALSGSYAPALPWLVLLTVMAAFSLLFSGYRFRKGEM